MSGNQKRWGLAVFLLFFWTTSAQAQQNWAESMVAPRTLDFGVIATGAEAVKTVTVTNSSQVQVHISQVTTACQCARAGNPSKTLLQPGEKATIEVSMDTRSFKQKRDTTLTILLDAPQFAEVRIPISAYIRQDVVIDPGKVDFGSVAMNTPASKTLKISYAGRADWNIRDVRINHESLKARLKELARNAQPVNGINVEYELEVTLSGTAKVGRLVDYLTLVTDDSRNPNVPLMVEGVVVSDMTISNPSLAVRALKPGQSAKVSLVVKGIRPFLVEDVDCGALKDQIVVTKGDKEEKVQVIQLEFTAPERPGRFSEKMQVRVQGREEPLEFSFSGTIL